MKRGEILTGTCPVCGVIFSYEYGGGAKRTVCSRRCGNARDNRRTGRARRLKHYYDITIEDWDRLLDQQEGRCAACSVFQPIVEVVSGAPQERGWNASKRHPDRFVVDHDHTTGDIRGILCDPCNRLIGIGREDPERLRGCAAYIERTSQVMERFNEKP